MDRVRACVPFATHQCPHWAQGWEGWPRVCLAAWPAGQHFSRSAGAPLLAGGTECGAGRAVLQRRLQARRREATDAAGISQRRRFIPTPDWMSSWPWQSAVDVGRHRSCCGAMLCFHPPRQLFTPPPVVVGCVVSGGLVCHWQPVEKKPQSHRTKSKHTWGGPTAKAVEAPVSNQNGAG